MKSPLYPTRIEVKLSHAMRTEFKEYAARKGKSGNEILRGLIEAILREDKRWEGGNQRIQMK